jgi:ribosomal protein S18 acetylase RimI-like enzyme
VPLDRAGRFTVARPAVRRERSKDVTSSPVSLGVMDGTPVTLRSTIDYRWLEEAAKADPMAHAYSLWDLTHYPDRTRFVSAVRGETTVGYLLIWLGRPALPVVHWYGSVPASSPLIEALPPPPVVAVVPPEVEPLVSRTRGAVAPRGILTMVRARGTIDRGIRRVEVRRLTRNDRPSIGAWALRRPDPVVTGYAAGDPEGEHLWGAFEDGYLVGIAGAAVRLPSIWVVAGVFVDPLARRRGVGRALMTSIIEAATSAGAEVGLYVREAAREARALYEGLGFRPAGRRVWLEYSAELKPG